MIVIKFFMNERRKFLWLATGIAVFSAATLELSGRSSDTQLTSSNSSRATAYTNYGENDPLFEAANLRAEATRACQSLSSAEQDDNIKRETDLGGMDSYMTFRQQALRDLYEGDLTLLYRYRTAILQGCLRTRNAPGDQEKADRISEIGLD
ncbi:hypothetical protein K2X83_02840 [Patescibacteria group bacterium]|nr:hypothetical protein [Patescibacteria group bacterium]